MVQLVELMIQGLQDNHLVHQVQQLVHQVVRVQRHHQVQQVHPFHQVSHQDHVVALAEVVIVKQLVHLNVADEKMGDVVEKVAE